MAYQRADPRPFAPQGFQPMILQHRELMVRTVTKRQPPTHEDYAIVSIHLLPQQPLQFLSVREIVQEFLEEHMNVRIRKIQRTHLGQALVRFVHAYDRDLLIHTSPHPMVMSASVLFVTIRLEIGVPCISIRSVG
jgi:hypothetical protein